LPRENFVSAMLGWEPTSRGVFRYPLTRAGDTKNDGPGVCFEPNATKMQCKTFFFDHHAAM